MSKTRHWLALGLTAFGHLGWSSVAQAKPEFPYEIQQFSIPRLSYLVPCSVCHIKDNTGASTPITPFALALRARGLSGSSDSLNTALTQLGVDGVDSDGDKVTDTAELQAGTDPNSSGNASLIDDREPGYGCGGSPPTGRDGGPAFGSALALAWLFLRRRRARL